MAPVGSYESLNAAIAAGADSVYFGVEQLNMRAASSVNFTLDDLSEIVRTAHAAGVSTVYVLGENRYEDLGASDIHPTYVVDSLKGLFV